MSIILCGLPKSGKTTIGQKLAKRLNWEFIDIDRLIERSDASHNEQQRSCRQIYREEGEAAFRSLEKKQILSLSKKTHGVIALGGGALADPENIESLRSLGDLIYLKTPVEILWKRIHSDTIPAYLSRNDPEKAFYEIAERRIVQFESVARWIIDTGGLTEDDVVDKILATIKQ